MVLFSLSAISRMHPSRMYTTRFGSHHDMSVPGGNAYPTLRRETPLERTWYQTGNDIIPLERTWYQTGSVIAPPVNRQTCLKHYLLATSLAGGNEYINEHWEWRTLIKYSYILPVACRRYIRSLPVSRSGKSGSSQKQSIWKLHKKPESLRLNPRMNEKNHGLRFTKVAINL